mmetsp:Transcript_75909/g.167528  ORF Transcript_75909/g.167528 Transcript_75909/m.167528 type:complete len:217 (-) Transcript_75909:70-720(-)
MEINRAPRTRAPLGESKPPSQKPAATDLGPHGNEEAPIHRGSWHASHDAKCLLVSWRLCVSPRPSMEDSSALRPASGTAMAATKVSGRALQLLSSCCSCKATSEAALCMLRSWPPATMRRRSGLACRWNSARLGPQRPRTSRSVGSSFISDAVLRPQYKHTKTSPTSPEIAKASQSPRARALLPWAATKPSPKTPSRRQLVDVNDVGVTACASAEA